MHKEVAVSDFYSSIAEHYDYIFPLSDVTLQMLVEVADVPSKRILDVACGSGSYAHALQSLGHEVVAIDNDERMLELAEAKDDTLDLRHMEMKDIRRLEGGFDLIYCIGNSLVHLDSLEAIDRFIQHSYDLLHTDGSLLVQIINYDRILDSEIDHLPTITNDRLSFERHYHRTEEGIDFHTLLHVDDEQFENHVTLYPVLFDDLIDSFDRAGFIGIQVFENFQGDSFDPKTSYMLILLATK